MGLNDGFAVYTELKRGSVATQQPESVSSGRALRIGTSPLPKKLTGIRSNGELDIPIVQDEPGKFATDEDLLQTKTATN